MMYYGHAMGAGWILIVFAVALPALLLAAGLVITQLRRIPVEPSLPVGPTWRGAEQILADRFARGEIDAEEYERRLRTLRATPY
jgi:putative membrane protein